MSDETGHGSSLTQAGLLALKVSAILEARPAALEVLIDHGFAPLRQPHLRAALAPTVTLEQALRIRSLSDAKEQALLAELLALFTTWRQPLGATTGRVAG
jgi:hypothetical protein